MPKKSRHRQQERQKSNKATRLSAALLYASYGVSVVPLHGTKEGDCTCGDEHCKRPGKHPRAKRGIADATADPQKIERLWAKWPSAKIGIVTGAPANLIAVETRRKTGRQKLREIMAINRTLPRTVTLQDRDCRLRFFRVKGNQPRSGDVAEGVRILGDGDFIVAPSLSSRDKRRFAQGRAFGEIDIARAPDWLFADLTSAESTNGQASSTVDGKPADGELVRPTPERIPFHPFVNIFPILAEEFLHELAQDIKDRGLLDPIVLLEGRILDGRCRYLACQSASVEPEFQDYVGDDPLGFVVSRNLQRRHLTESQRAIVAARFADLKLGANQHSQGLPIGRAADLLNVGERSVARAREVLRGGVPELVTAVEAGKIAVSAAADLSGMPEPEQREMVASIPGGEADGKARIKKAGKSARRKTSESNKQVAGIPGAIAPAAEVEKLKSELAAANERQRKLEAELEQARVTVLESRAASSIRISPDLEIPPFLDRRPLSPEDLLAFDAAMAAWASSTELRAALVAASAVVLERVIAALRVDIASASSPAG
jgi:ParB-like chromosome segregation protein Spo0J